MNNNGKTTLYLSVDGVVATGIFSVLEKESVSKDIDQGPKI